MVILQLSGYYIQLAENDLTLRKMTTKPSIIIWSILPKDVPVTCKSVFFTSCKIIKMVHYLLLLNTPGLVKINEKSEGKGAVSSLRLRPEVLTLPNKF